MSTPISFRRGTEAERVLVVFANGEPVYCTDSNKLYIGDGTTLGGVAVTGSGSQSILIDSFANISVMTLGVGELAFAIDVSKLFIGNGVTVGGIEVKSDDYVRAGFSRRFSQNVTFTTISQALDLILDLALPIPDLYYWGDVATNDPINDGVAFLGALASAAYTSGAKQLSHLSINSYRVLSYPKAMGLIVGIQDPGFMNASIINAYEAQPREINVGGTAFYVYVSTDPYQSPSGQAVTYILP